MSKAVHGKEGEEKSMGRRAKSKAQATHERNGKPASSSTPEARRFATPEKLERKARRGGKTGENSTAALRSENVPRL